VGAPVRYTALATAAGFGVLVIGGIVPVRVFGLFTAFGTLVIRLMSFSFIPAVMMLVGEDRLRRASRRESMEAGASRSLAWLGRLSVSRPRAVVVSGVVLLAVALVGLPRVRINNNMVRWFKPASDVRVADAVINEQLGGSSLLYVVVSGAGEDALKDPAALRYLEAVQRDLDQEDVVGKTTSVVDLVKRVNRVMLDDRPDQERIPDTPAAVGQYLFLFGMAAKPATLDNLITGSAERANLWVQLKTWDAGAVERVLNRLQAYQDAQPPPGLRFQPAGIAYFNLVWNREVLRDMIRTFVAALAAVLLILTISFRSWRWGLVSFVPSASRSCSSTAPSAMSGKTSTCRSPCCRPSRWGWRSTSPFTSFGATGSGSAKTPTRSARCSGRWRDPARGSCGTPSSFPWRLP
jgi:predicted RND superfamily exporter protein